MPADLALIASAGEVTFTLRERLGFLIESHWGPLVCSMLIGAVLGVLGCFVILRRMALIGDAISHAVLPGVVIAFLLVGSGITGLFMGALLAGVFTAVGINLVSRHSRVKEDAAIGIVFTSMFAVGVVIISSMESGTHFDLNCFLFGKPLAITRTDLVTVMAITPVVLGIIVALFRPLKLMSFDPVMASTAGFNVSLLHYLLMVLLSVSIVAALRSVGVIMAVAMLITPAAVGYQLSNRLWSMLLIAGVTGSVSALAGMVLAFSFNTPPGPTMVLVATGLFLVTMAVAPEHGLWANWRRRRIIRAHIVEEDVLKTLARQMETPDKVPGDLMQAMAPTGRQAVDRAVRRLERGRFLSRSGDRLALTDTGHHRALQLIRAHRLWETYLAEHDVPPEELHEEAERLEHAHELADDLDAALGHPTLDPHGEPIPRPRRA